jgi:NTE family protein
MPLSADWIPFIKKVFFFAAFSEEELGKILSQMSLLSLPKGAVLFRQGDAGDAMFLIQSGRLTLTRNEGGQEKVAAYLGRGESLGEMSLLTGEPRANTATADSTVELLVLYRQDFEPLLHSMPSMALHLSRILSRRLVESILPKDSASYPTKIHPVMSPLPLEDRVLFCVNLGISLVEQTRRRVLLLDILDHDSGVFAKALGLHPVQVGEASLRQGDLQSPDIIHRLTVYHPSGLELLSLPLSLMDGKLMSSAYPFFSLLRSHYDITLVVTPPKVTPFTRVLWEESDRLFYVERDVPAPGESEALEGVLSHLSREEIFRVQLQSGETRPHTPVVDYHIPWPADLARDFERTRTPFLPASAGATHRRLDRLARQMGGLRIGLAMGSGAALGYSLIGILQVLERNGIYPDVISGTSMGALIGSFYASGKNPAELEEIALGITRRKLLTMADPTLPWQGILIGRGVLRFLKSILGDVSFEELGTPFACVATDIMTGEEIVLRQGKVAEAVRGSISLPFFFQPYFHQGRFLADGGLVNPVPTSVIASMGADILLSVNLTTKPGVKRSRPGRRNPRRYSSSYWKGPNIIEVVSKTIYTMQYEIAQARAELSDAVLAPDLSNFTWAEFDRAADIIKIGAEYMEESLPKIKSLLPFFADYCRVPLRARAPIRIY